MIYNFSSTKVQKNIYHAAVATLYIKSLKIEMFGAKKEVLLWFCLILENQQEKV